MSNASFPLIQTKNHAVKLTQSGEKAVKSFHPWIFENSISKLPDNITPGDRAIIFDRKKNKFIGLGLLDPFSPIRVKMLVFRKSATLDKDWFNNKIQESLEIRAPLLATKTNSYRLIYGENDGLPGLIIDIYDKTAVVKLYSHIWIPYLEWICEIIPSIIELDCIVLRLSRALQKNPAHLHGLSEGQVLFGNLEDEVIIFNEYGVKFSANVLHGHKTGYFLDHRDNRKKCGAFAQNKNVLDVFCYAGGFSVHALVGGAESVTSIDISKQALKLAEMNASLNGQFDNHITVAGDAFQEMSKLIDQGMKYELVIVDPPSFAKKAIEVPAALNAYKKLTRLAISLAANKSILVLASCSSRVSFDEFEEVVLQQFNTQRRKYTVLESTNHDIDHPVTFPEGSYLKCLYIELH